MGQLISAQNKKKHINAYQCNYNEVKSIVPLYNLTTGDFLGLSTTLAYIILRVDVDEVFPSFGFNSEKSKVLLCSAKDKILNAFPSTAFKKHYHNVFSIIYYQPQIKKRKITSVETTLIQIQLIVNTKTSKIFLQEKKNFFPYHLHLKNDE